MAPQNIPRAISVLTLGNKVILYCITDDTSRWQTSTEKKKKKKKEKKSKKLNDPGRQSLKQNKQRNKNKKQIIKK